MSVNVELFPVSVLAAYQKDCAVGTVFHVLGSQRTGHVICGDGHDRAEGDTTEAEGLAEHQTRVPMPMTMPAATGTRLIGLAKSMSFSFQIFAPSRPIMPYRITVIPTRTPPGVAATTAPNLGESPKTMATSAAT